MKNIIQQLLIYSFGSIYSGVDWKFKNLTQREKSIIINQKNLNKLYEFSHSENKRKQQPLTNTEIITILIFSFGMFFLGLYIGTLKQC